jgi:hypothetical protein
MAYLCYFDTPVSYKNKNAFYNVGGSPYLLEVFCEHLEQNKNRINEIFIGFYLFNNSILNDKLESLARLGIRIHVITIPIEGYDAASAKTIIDIKTQAVLKTATKYDLAKEFFSRHYNREIPNYTLYFFPHIYLRSSKVKTFARGNMPYSLHLKSFLIKYKNEGGDLGISSSNFAVRDLIKEENLLIINNDSACFKATSIFFDDLIRNSIPIYEFDFNADYTNYKVAILQNNQTTETGFIAPFYFDSAFHAEEAIKDLIDSAKKSISIVAQHICPIGYTVQGKFHSELPDEEIKREGFLQNLIAKANAGIKVSFISQTFASGNYRFDAGFRKPANKTSFIKFFNKIKDVPNILYTVNENIHSKYIIVDDKVLVSSFNYTPTQFIYLDKVDIKKFENNPGKNFNGIYCETGQYCIISNNETKNKYQQNFNELLSRKETKIVKQFNP